MVSPTPMPRTGLSPRAAIAGLLALIALVFQLPLGRAVAVASQQQASGLAYGLIPKVTCVEEVANWPAGPGNLYETAASGTGGATGKHDLALKVSVKGKRHFRESLKSFEGMAIQLTLWHSEAEVWHFDVPPTPFTSRKMTVCPVGGKHSQTVSGDATISIDNLDKGFYKVGLVLVNKHGQNVAIGETVRIWVQEEGSSAASTSAILSELSENAWAREQDLFDEEQSLQRQRLAVASSYIPLHPSLRTMPVEEIVHPELRAALATRTVDALLSLLSPLPPAANETAAAGGSLFTFPALSDRFCRLLIEEAKNALEWQQAQSGEFTRPNTMNNYGFVMEELGIDLMPFVQAALSPLAGLAFPEWGGDAIDSIHSFTISYSMDGDRDLDRHMDQSEVTVNVNLGGDFSGGEVYFTGQRDSPEEGKENVTLVHRPGVGLIHVGQHWHGAAPLKEGERHNLVLWLRSSAFKTSPAHAFHSECVKAAETSRLHTELR